ncbi:helix-turn-helix domain-containing protein [Aquimarina pacifica]|uniref:helix-turn-helix domain-containing protein n=1 Tax=Aquimarina pacifica TaxID=1296415 RepID=UPI00046F237E|nr:helix-turn-helix transcriptional regulator [Aquimarina pacifica]
MVNSKDFGIRIQKIMDHNGISASSFADYLGVGRSSISHILSGRNKPSLDFVMKIIEAYTDVDMQWLLYGKGTFPKSNNTLTENIKMETPKNISITQEVSSPSTEIEQDLFSQTILKEKMESTYIEPEEKKNTSTSFMSNEKIDRIVIFYQDGTFTSYETKKT